jgi:hypothetical protein
MGDTNYFSGIVRIMETPKQHFVKNNTAITTFRVEVPQNRNNKLISLVFWGKLGGDVKDFYRSKDYILIEGYISLRDKKLQRVMSRPLKQTTITVLKVSPILLNPIRSNSKILK